jgi:hypothetical protein
MADVRAGPERWRSWYFAVVHALLGACWGRAAPSRAWFRRFCWAVLRRERGTLGALRAVIGTPARAAKQARRAIAEHGEGIARAYGVSVGAQYRQLVMLGVTFGIEPESYYNFGLFRPEMRRHAGDFVQRREANVLFQLLAAREAIDDFAVVHDKQRFAAWCAAHGLPTPSILAVFEGGARVDRRGALVLPECDLFSKPTEAYGGTGARRWCHVQPGTWTADGATYSRDGVCDALAEQSHRGATIILQPCVQNHERVLPLTPLGLCTARVMTVRPPEGEPELLAAAYRMPARDASTDNYSRGGIAAAVDIGTGRLGLGVERREELCMNTIAEHPTTGVTFEGFELPRWKEATALALHAHRCLSRIACVGWDIALTPTGVMLMECNFNPGMDLPQSPSGSPLGRSNFVPYLDAHLRRSFSRRS